MGLRTTSKRHVGPHKGEPFSCCVLVHATGQFADVIWGNMRCSCHADAITYGSQRWARLAQGKESFQPD